MPHPDRPSRPPRPDARRNDGPRDDTRPADAPPRNDGPRNGGPRPASRDGRDAPRPPTRSDTRGPGHDAPRPPTRSDTRGPGHDAPRPPARSDARGPGHDAPRPSERSDARTPPARDARPAREAPRDDRPTPRDTRDTRPPVRNDPRDEPRGPRRDLRDDRGPRRDDLPRDPPRDEPRAEIKVCGVNACQAVAERRPDDVRRVYLRESCLSEFGAFLRRCAANRIAYHVVDDDELAKITQSTHHEGVCFIVRERLPASLPQLLAVPGARCLVYLDDVQNPHNLGAIVRVCAHFGAAAVLLAGSDGGVSTAMLRTAEGGGEWVDVVPVEPGPAPLLAARAAGFRLIATAARAPHDLHARRLPQRIILMLGSESHGLSPAVAKLADESVRIPGTGKLDSLNVACACSVLLSEYWRTHHAT